MTRGTSSSLLTMGLTGYVQGVRQNFTGGLFSFQTGASVLDTDPAWDMSADGWYADTLGFLTAPRSEFTFNMQAVDEHGRRDGTPASLSFEVGYPPCVQCVEILPGVDVPSAFTPDLECYDPDAGGHPCFGDTATFFIKSMSSPAQPGRTYLEQTGINYLAIHKVTLRPISWMIRQIRRSITPSPATTSRCRFCFTVRTMRRRPGPGMMRRWRSMAWQYQVDYECDPWNAIHDGGGIDDITRVDLGRWATPRTCWKSTVLAALWRMNVQVGAPATAHHGADVLPDHPVHHGRWRS